MVIEIQGGAHLHEFSSFSVRAIRTFDPTLTGPRCLRGYRRVTPPTNRPIAIHLSATAPLIYVHGRSAHGAAHDVHLPLVPSQGESVTIPLTHATPEKRAAVSRARSLLEAAQWTFARTMPDNPHTYTSRRTWADPAAFDFTIRTIRALGYRAPYTPPGTTRIAYWETQFDIADGFVWSGYLPVEQTGWVNRKHRAGAAADLVDQILVVTDARRLDVPALRADFAGLPPNVTGDPHFQAGVAVFGYTAVASDRRPRLRPKTRRT